MLHGTQLPESIPLGSGPFGKGNRLFRARACGSRSELVCQDDFQSAADFPAVIGPEPRAPVTEIAGLRAK